MNIFFVSSWYKVSRIISAKDNNLFWKLACVALEKQRKLWKNQESMDKMLLIDVQYSTIDALLLMHVGNIHCLWITSFSSLASAKRIMWFSNAQGGTTCISGARDRSLVYWKLSTQENECEKAVSIQQAHNGWIWDLTAIDNTIYSCSWDHSIKSWLFTDTGLVHLKTYET